jgi:hypothetical protein
MKTHRKISVLKLDTLTLHHDPPKNRLPQHSDSTTLRDSEGSLRIPQVTMFLPHVLSELILARKSSTLGGTANDLAAMDALIDAVD